MKKTLLLAAALLVSASSAFADMYVIGSDVNGSNWALAQADAKMTETSSGVYEWTGTSLGSGFKINDGSWDGAWNIGSSGPALQLNTPYNYVNDGSSSDIVIDIPSNNYLASPKVTLNTNAGTITVTGTPTEKAPVDPSDVTFYIIGSDVNGKSWALAEPDCAFTDEGNGIYKWTGDVLGTGFKINDGTWSNEDYNIGSNGSDLSLDVPYYYTTGGSSGNIAFSGFTSLENPVVTLNLNDQSVTVSGSGSGESKWYLAGINNVWELTSEWELKPTADPNVFSGVFEIIEQAGEFKISDDGWAHELGTNTPDEVFINPTHLEAQLDDVYGEAGNVPYELEEGIYTVTVDVVEYTVKFEAGDAAVNVIGAEEGTPVYFNLQGVRVQNPDKGIYVRVINGKAAKIVK